MLCAPIRIASPGGHARRGKLGHDLHARLLAACGVLARGARQAAVPVALAGLAVLLYGRGHLGYDAGWALLWGKQLAMGDLPSFAAAGAPTPHPLANVVAAMLQPLGATATGAWIFVGSLGFGLLTWAAYRLGAALFDALAGALFAAIVFTRAQFIVLQSQGPVDVAFVALILMAAALEAERPRRGAGALALLIGAGLLRPEGWLFIGAYVLYLLPARRSTLSRLRALAAGAAAPCAWAAFDAVVTGDPLHSLHGTQQLAVALDRPRDLAAALGSAPSSLSDILGMPLALVGLVGCLAAVVMLYERALLPAALIALGLCCYLAIGVAGLPVLNRYLVVPVITLGLFAVVALVGWQRLPRGDLRRRPWQAASILIGCALALSVPSAIHRTHTSIATMQQKSAVERDLQALAAAPAWRERGDRGVNVATRRAVPLLAVWLDLPLDRISADEPASDARALIIRPASPAVAANYFSLTSPPWSAAPDPAWHELYRNRSWVLYSADGPRSDRSAGGRREELAVGGRSRRQ